MAEQRENLTGVRLLPIFPLPLVLMPYEYQPLHIFEPRYRRMIADICDVDMIFGLSYYRGDTFDDRPAIGSIGCATEVHDIDLLEDGRSNISSVGRTRYRILRYVDADTPYLMAEVEFFTDEPVDEALLKPTADRVFGLFLRVARLAHDVNGQHDELPPIEQAPPENLSFLIGAAFGFDLEKKYRLVELRSTLERLEIIAGELKASAEKLESELLIKKIAPTNGHAKKKPGH